MVKMTNGGQGGTYVFLRSFYIELPIPLLCVAMFTNGFFLHNVLTAYHNDFNLMDKTVSIKNIFKAVHQNKRLTKSPMPFYLNHIHNTLSDEYT